MTPIEKCYRSVPASMSAVALHGPSIRAYPALLQIHSNERIAMSKHRVRSGSGWKNHKELPQGPNGRALCRWCGVEVPKGRRSFCSDACVHEHKLRSDPGYLREQVFQRDFGVCAICGTDCDKVMRVFKALLRKAGLKAAQFPRKVDREPERYGALDMFRRQFPWFKPYISPWAADHIVPVVEGGGECGIENIRTLCLGCHASVTRELRGRLKQIARDSDGEDAGLSRSLSYASSNNGITS
jgi:5-methylcytosine-specific restriction enzyme A